MLRKVRSWYSYSRLRKIKYDVLRQLVKENAGENSVFPIPRPELPTVEMFALLLWKI